LKTFFTYTKINGYSGQNNISIQILKLLAISDSDYEEIHLFPLRSKTILGKLKVLMVYWPTLALKAFRFFSLHRAKYISNFQQTTYSMLGFSLIHWPLLLKKQHSLILALNGSIFYKWNKQGLNYRLFKLWLTRANSIATVGSNMESALHKQFGIDNQKLFRLDNFSANSIESVDFIFEKFKSPVTNITYLSLFVEKKGYKEFVEAINKVVDNNNLNIKINFCGKFVITEECGISQTLENFHKTVQTLKKIGVENDSVDINIWDNGIYGEDKWSVLRDTHIFVLPTYYANEAQPIALIEAASTGAAIISGSTGEIPNMFSSDAIKLLDVISVDTLTSAIEELMLNRNQAIQMGKNAYQEYRARYTEERFNSAFLNLLNQ